MSICDQSKIAATIFFAQCVAHSLRKEMRLQEIWTVDGASHIVGGDTYLHVVGRGEIVCYNAKDASVIGFTPLPHPVCRQIGAATAKSVVVLCGDGYVYLLSMETHSVVARCDIMFSGAIGATHLDVCKGVFERKGAVQSDDELCVFTDDACFVLSLSTLRLKTRVPHNFQNITTVAYPFVAVDGRVVRLFPGKDGAEMFQVKNGTVQKIFQMDNLDIFCVCDMAFATNQIVSLDDPATVLQCDGAFAAACDGKRIAFVTPDGGTIRIVTNPAAAKRKALRGGGGRKSECDDKLFGEQQQRVHDLAFVGKQYLAIRTSDGTVRVCRVFAN